jgi:hypothetical protein
MPRLHYWRNFKLALLRSRSEGKGLGSGHERGKSGAQCKDLLTYLKHGNRMTGLNRVHTAIDSAPTAGNAEVKSP